MGLIGPITKHPVPHEPGEWIETRLLSWGEMGDAQRAAVRDSIRMSAAFTDQERAAMQAVAGEGTAPSEQAPEDRYDPATLLKFAVVAWSYDAEVEVEKLDARTGAWLLEVVIGENVRSAEAGEDSAVT